MPSTKKKGNKKSKTVKNTNLRKIREECSKMRDVCHKNLNRVLDTMVDESDKMTCQHLCKFAKCCVVMERLCECIESCCCNIENVSTSLKSEYKSRCKEIKSCCEKLLNCLPKSKSDYLRCKIIKKMCD